jgi:hypothetical protein
MRAGPRIAWPALLLFATVLAACAAPVDVSVKGGSASDTKWRVGIPF